MFCSNKSFFFGAMAFLMVLTFLFGCSQKTLESKKDPQSQYRQDWFVDTPESEAELKTWGTGSEGQIMKAAEEGPASIWVHKFEEQGFQLTYQYSFTVTGEVTNPNNDSLITLEIIIIPMEMPGDSTIAAYVTQISNPSVGWVVMPDLVSTIARPDYEMQDMGDYQLWLSGYMPQYSMNLYQDNSTAYRWSWKRWLKCSFLGSFIGCGTASLGCLTTAPGYLACLGLWCGGAVAASMLACAADQLL